MKTKKVEKVITTLKDRIDHPLKRHLTEIPTQVKNLNGTRLPQITVLCCPVYQTNSHLGLSDITLVFSIKQLFRRSAISQSDELTCFEIFSNFQQCLGRGK